MMGFKQGEFKDPGREYSTVFAWAWNAPVTKEGIKNKLEEMQRAGINGVYVIPQPKEFRPVTMSLDMQPGYLTEEYFELIKYLCDTAKEMGFEFWLYDEGGWPSGSACTQIVKQRPDLRRKTVTCIKVETTKGTKYTPPIHQKSFLAAFAKDKDGNYTRIRDTIVCDGESAVIEYRCMATYLTYIHNEEYNTDILDPDTVKLFLELTHEGYKKALGHEFGKYIKYMFDDEPSVDPHGWTWGLEKIFYEDYGYDILDYLPVIKNQVAADTEERRQAESDWRRLLCRLAMKNFFIPIRDWCRENNILSIGHLDSDHDAWMLARAIPCDAMPLEVLRCYDLPGVDCIWRHIYPAGLGAASYQKGIPFFPRFASSAAAQIGRSLAITETMAIYGEGATPSVMRYVFGAQAVRGINVFNCNSISYGDQPIRPGFTPARPGYEHLPQITKYLSRLSYLAQLGKAECSTAVYLPCEDITKGYSADEFHKLGLALEKKQVYFDIIDDAFVREAEIKGDALCMGIAAYKNVIIPKGANLPADVREKLNGFIAEDAAPTVVCDNVEMLVMKRNIDNGSTLYFLFNNSKDIQTVYAKFDENKPAYRLFIEDGRIERCIDYKFTLEMGEIAAVLFTDDEIAAEAQPNTVAEIGINGGFTLKKTAEFFSDEKGARRVDAEEEAKTAELGSWAEYFGEEFSGKAVYTASFEADDKFLDGEIYELDLGMVEYTADVIINGKFAGIASLTPHKLRFDGSFLQQHNTIEITVANTACNRTTTADVYSHLHQRDIGPYHQIEVMFERESLGGGLIGPVVLKRLG